MFLRDPTAWPRSSLPGGVHAPAEAGRTPDHLASAGPQLTGLGTVRAPHLPEAASGAAPTWPCRLAVIAELAEQVSVAARRKPRRDGSASTAAMLE